MREIKFRGIYIDTDEWVYGYLVNMGDSNAVIFDPNAGSLGTYFVVKKETLGQYTGKEDKDERGIYGGDVVKFKSPFEDDDTDYFGEIVYRNDWTSFGCYHGTESPINKEGGRGWSACGDFREAEIIGNIHENPELLEGG